MAKNGSRDVKSLEFTHRILFANFLPPPIVDESLTKNMHFLELIAACIPVLEFAPVLTSHGIVMLSDDTQTVAF